MAPHASTRRPEGITFGPFRLDFRSGQLLRNGEPIALRPKTWAVLHHLAERPGELVARHELLDAIWPDVALTDSVLSTSISELRRALGDSFRAPRIIETVQRRGFRFLAEVRDIGPQPPPPGPDRRAAADRSPAAECFVGRGRELQRLVSMFAKACGGQRQCVLVTGEPGMGKTALVRTFLSSAAIRTAPAPVWIARGTCIEQHGAREAYLPVLAALERLARRQDDGRLTPLLRRLAPTWLAQMPGLIGEGDEGVLRRSLRDVRPERMLRELAAFIEALTADVALVLVLEDLHWSDASTVELMAFLAQRSDAARLLLIGTFRPAEAIVREHPLMPLTRTLVVRRQCLELPLPELGEGDVRCYLDQRFAGNGFPPALARVIHRHTDGNPLFMIGVVDHLLSRGDILDTAPGWVLHASAETIALGVPDDVRLLIENDLAGVSPADHALLQAASVAGGDFTASVVAAACDRDVAEVETRCEACVRSQRFLRVAGEVEWPDRSVARRYAFVHELYRQALYQQIAKGQRLRLHQRIGQALESAYGGREMEIAPQLAAHFERGRDDARALRYLQVAAAGARLRFANREAMAYVEAALALLAHRPEDDRRRRQELELRLLLGAILIDLTGFASEEVRENYDRAAELATAVGRTAQRFDVAYARWYLQAARGERDAAMASAAQLDRVARRLGRAERAVAVAALVRTATFEGRFSYAQRLMRRLAPQPAPRRSGVPAFGPEPVLDATTHATLALWGLGHPERARAAMRGAVERARRLGHPATLVGVLMQAALLELWCRSAPTAQELADEAVLLATEHGLSVWRAVSGVVRGGALEQQGRESEGIAAIEAELTAMQATHFRYFAAFAYAFIAEGHLRAGEFAGGLSAAEAGLAVAGSSLDRAYLPELWRLKGELLLRQVERQRPALSDVEGPALSDVEGPAPSDVEGSRVERPPGARSRRPVGSRATTVNCPEAERCFQRALGMARAARARSFELRAATSLARAWHARGRTADARRLLAGICQWFGTRSGNADLDEAKALLLELAPLRRPQQRRRRAVG